MGATTVAAIDPKPRYLKEVRAFKAGGTIVSGSLVSFDASGTSETVNASTSSLGSVVGIALNSASSGEYVAVAGNGCELMCILEATDTDPDAGHTLTVSTVAGCAAIGDMAIWAHNAEGAGLFPIGISTSDSTAGSGTTGATCYVLLNMTPPWTAQS